ncbi:MAG: hypothetical protein DMG23_01740, partial [Acidobacteria bacterium]
QIVEEPYQFQGRFIDVFRLAKEEAVELLVARYEFHADSSGEDLNSILVEILDSRKCGAVAWYPPAFQSVSALSGNADLRGSTAGRCFLATYGLLPSCA